MQDSKCRPQCAGFNTQGAKCRTYSVELDIQVSESWTRYEEPDRTRKVKFRVWNLTCYTYATPTSVIGAAIGSAGALTENALSTDDIRASIGVLIVDVDVSSANAGALTG
jgi:hypothetical protein